MTNKNSQYVQSLVSFILDTKPFHGKLTEINEIYQFSDSMTVHFDERTFNSVMTKAAWAYPYFSGGPTANIPAIRAHRLVSPEFRAAVTNNQPVSNLGAFKVGRDEDTSLPLVPQAYDPKSIQGVGLADAGIQRGGNPQKVEAFVEGHDVFLSHGAYVFQIKQTNSSQPEVLGRFDQSYAQGPAPVPAESGIIYTDFPLVVSLDFVADSLSISGPAAQIGSTMAIEVSGPGIVKVIGLSADPNYQPTFTEKRNENVLAQATAKVQHDALNSAKTGSAINKVRALLVIAQQQIAAAPNDLGYAVSPPDFGKSTAQAAVTDLLTIIDATAPTLPNDYETLLNALNFDTGSGPRIPLPVGYASWKGQDVTFPFNDQQYFEADLKAASPGLFFNLYTDISQRESGKLAFSTASNGTTNVYNIVPNGARAIYEEYRLHVVTSSTYFLYGSHSGLIGSIELPSTTAVNFTSPNVSFTIQRSADLVTGEELLLSPSAKVTIHKDAPLEAWSLVKVNPIAYTRPAFISTRYGYIQSASSVIGSVDIVDQTLPTSTVILEAVSTTSFSVNYGGIVTVGVPFNDGKLSFTIVQGSEIPFVIGDRFIIEIENKPATALDLDLYFGYDSGPFSGVPAEDELRYNTVNSAVQDYLLSLDFNYDSRFVAYDLASFNLGVSQAATDGRQWRLRALPDLARPLLLQNSTPTNLLNEIGTEDASNPNAATQFDMPNVITEGAQSTNDTDGQPDIQVWYASSFALEYLNGITWTNEATVPVGSTYSSAQNGLSFTLVEAAKPFIATRVKSSYVMQIGQPPVAEVIEGGDVISFTILNPLPSVLDVVSLVSPRTPRLVMHGDSYHFSVPAAWTLKFVDAEQYTIQGIYTTGDNNGEPVFAIPLLVQTSNGYSFKNDDIHFTIKPGRGFGVNDSFIFTTFESKPSYLVYGSVSGWQQNATVGEFYWNGKIGFKIKAPEAVLFSNGTQLDKVNNTWLSGTAALTKLRFDTPSAQYTLHGHSGASAPNWALHRNGEVVATGRNVLADQYISITVPDAVNGQIYVLDIQGDDHALAFGHDLAIVRTTVGRSPNVNDFVLFTRTKQDDVLISVKPYDTAHAVALAKLSPSTIDIRFTDMNVNSGVPLGVTSPETDVLQGWIPAIKTYLDTATSTAEFSDPATHVVVTAAATGETIGRMEPIDTDANSSVFRWDTNFHNSYLPLNVEATIVTLGSGMNERVKVNMTEGLFMLLSGGGLATDAMFNDNVAINILDTNFWKINQTLNTDANVAISDGPFGGFLPGYDNRPFDLEDGVDGMYDQGYALTEYYQQAKELSQLNVPTPQQQALLLTLTALIDPYLNGSIDSTTLGDFISNLNADPYVGLPNADFGIPSIGMGIGIENRSNSSVGSAVLEAMVIYAEDFGFSLDFAAYDVGSMDAYSDRTAVVFVTGNIPSPLPVLGDSFDQFETPLYVTTPSHIVDLAFDHDIATTPDIKVWYANEAAPMEVAIVERISTRTFRFRLSATSEVKLVVA